MQDPACPSLASVLAEQFPRASVTLLLSTDRGCPLACEDSIGSTALQSGAGTPATDSDRSEPSDVAPSLSAYHLQNTT